MARVPTLLDFDVESTDWDGPYELVTCSKALHPSSIPPVRYSLNPYSGCEHGCVYCFAPGHLHMEHSNWRVVRVKTNIVERLSKEIDHTEGMIGLGTVTDAYQAAEGRFLLSRLCLELIRNKRRSVFIITKSPLILRDADILAQMDSTVAFTITNPDPRICRMTEPGAPVTEERLKALKELTERGIDTCVFIAPVTNKLEGLETELAESIASTGVKKVFIDPLKYRDTDMDRLKRMDIRPSPSAEMKIKEACLKAGLEMI